MPCSVRPTRVIAAWAVAAAAMVLGVHPAGPAHAVEQVEVTGQLAGRAFPAGAGDPISLSPERPTPLMVLITNQGDEAVEVRTITLSGRVVGLPFFSYQTSVAISVEPRATVNREFLLDLAGLKYQATGLFNARITLLDQQRQTVGSSATAVDVRGSWRSVYVVFGLVLAVGTVVSFLRAVRDLAHHKLSPNRWFRGVRFLIPGIGFGLTLIFASSSCRAFLVGPGAWIAVLLISATALFGVGFLTPNPDQADTAAGAHRRREYAEPPGQPLL